MLQRFRGTRGSGAQRVSTSSRNNRTLTRAACSLLRPASRRSISPNKPLPRVATGSGDLFDSTWRQRYRGEELGSQGHGIVRVLASINQSNTHCSGIPAWAWLIRWANGGFLCPHCSLHAAVPWIHRSGVTVAILRHQTPDRATCVDRDANARAPPAASVLPVHCTYLLNCRDRIGWAGSNTIAVNEGEARRMYVRTRTPANDRRRFSWTCRRRPSCQRLIARKNPDQTARPRRPCRAAAGRRRLTGAASWSSVRRIDGWLIRIRRACSADRFNFSHC
jgi:hypothetical protein